MKSELDASHTATVNTQHTHVCAFVCLRVRRCVGPNGCGWIKYRKCFTHNALQWKLLHSLLVECHLQLRNDIRPYAHGSQSEYSTLDQASMMLRITEFFCVFSKNIYKHVLCASAHCACACSGSLMFSKWRKIWNVKGDMYLPTQAPSGIGRLSVRNHSTWGGGCPIAEQRNRNGWPSTTMNGPVTPAYLHGAADVQTRKYT